MEEYVKRIDHKLVHKGKIVEFYEDTMAFTKGNTAIWDYIHHKGAAAIIPVMDDGRLIMVRQFRQAAERTTLEIPAGGLDAGETMKEATGEVTNKPFCKIGYTPKPGTERLVHLKIVRKGNRYDSETGKEIVQPYVQTFTYGEYKNFEKNADLIGMKIEEVLYNPYKE